MVEGSSRLTSADFPVTESERAKLLRAFVGQLDAQCVRRSDPVLGVVAGQPAAGKSRTITEIQREAGRAFAVLDSDELRLWHPRLEEIRQRDPFRMDVLSNGPVGEWMSGSLTHCRDHRYDTLLENTMTNPDQVRTTAESFRGAGFSVQADVLAVPEAQSRLGIVTRYLTEVDVGPSARWTTEASHTGAFAGMSAGLRELEGVFDAVRVRDRDGGVLYTGNDTDAAATVLDTHRGQAWTPAQSRAWRSDYARVCPRLVEPGMITDQTRTVLRNLVTDAEKIMPHKELPPDHGRLARSVGAAPSRAPCAAEVMPPAREARPSQTFKRGFGGPSALDSEQGKSRGVGLD